MFERFGRVTRVFLAKDRETGRAKGFAFISFQERSDAAKACEKMDGCEFSPLRTTYLMLIFDSRLWSLDLACRNRQTLDLDNFFLLRSWAGKVCRHA